MNPTSTNFWSERMRPYHKVDKIPEGMAMVVKSPKDKSVVLYRGSSDHVARLIFNVAIMGEVK